MKKKKAIISKTNLLVFLFMFFICIILTELILQSIPAIPTYRQNDLDIIFSDNFLYQIKPHSRLDINSQGYRDYEFVREKTDKKRVFVLGDSFVMGENVPVNNTFPKRMELFLGQEYEVYNMGTIGYGPDQSYIRFMKEGINYNPDIVILTIFPANDFNDIYKNKLFYADNGKLEFSDKNILSGELPKIKILAVINKIFFGKYLSEKNEKNIFTTLFLDNYDLLYDFNGTAAQDKIELMRLILKEFKSQLAKKGIEFYILILPSYENTIDDRYFKSINVSQEYYFVNERIMEVMCIEESFQCVSLREHFTKPLEELPYDMKDHHLSKYGNYYVASLLKAVLLEAKTK